MLERTSPLALGGFSHGRLRTFGKAQATHGLGRGASGSRQEKIRFGDGEGDDDGGGDDGDDDGDGGDDNANDDNDE